MKKHKIDLYFLGIILLFFLNGFFYLEIQSANKEKSQINFEKDTSFFTLQIQKNLEIASDRLNAVLAYIEASEFVHESEFQALISKLDFFDKSTYLRAIAVIPLLKENEIEDFNKALLDRKDSRLQQGYQPITVKKVASRKHYAPVVYTESPAGKDKILGYDLASSEERYQTGLKAQKDKAIYITPPVTLSQDNQGDYPSVLLMAATDHGNLGLRNYLANSDFRPLFIAASFTPGKVIETIFSSYEKNEIFSLQVRDFTDENNTKVIYSNINNETDNENKVTSQILFAGRKWLFEYTPTKIYLQESQPGWLNLVFVTGFVLILLLGGILHRLSKLTSTLEFQKLDLMAANEKSQIANKEKSRFLANMSHELRTPMHAIMSFSSLALKHSKSEKVQGYLQKINTSGIRLTKLLNDLLDISKLESGKLTVKFSPLDICNLIQDSIDEVSSLIDNKGLRLTFNPPTGMTCEADKSLLAQVIINLLSNAIKFSPDEGRIEINIQQYTSNNTQFIQFSITDEGVGIPANEVEEVFDSFIQSSKTRSDSGGTGLGLPISREIILLHSGKIWAESPPRNKKSGSLFVFQIPKDQK